MSQLSPHFRLQEFLRSQTASRNGIDMTPPQDVVRALKRLCTHVLEPLREEIGRPIVISSGYRPPALNRLIGGATNSQHTKGEAADILVPGYSPLSIWNHVRSSKLPYDQVIEEFGQWTHVSHKYGTCRRASLVATRRDGRVMYERIPNTQER